MLSYAKGVSGRNVWRNLSGNITTKARNRRFSSFYFLESCDYPDRQPTLTLNYPVGVDSRVLAHIWL